MPPPWRNALLRDGEATTTIALLKTLFRKLVLRIEYDVPPQDVTVDLRRSPARPLSGFRIANPRLLPPSQTA